MDCAFNFGSPRLFIPLPDSSSLAFGVCHITPCKAEPSGAAVAGTHVGRWKSDPFRIPPAVGQPSQDSGGRTFIESPFGFVHNGGGGSSDGCDVLQKEEPRTASVGGIGYFEEQ